MNLLVFVLLWDSIKFFVAALWTSGYVALRVKKALARSHVIDGAEGRACNPHARVLLEPPELGVCSRSQDESCETLATWLNASRSS